MSMVKKDHMHDEANGNDGNKKRKYEESGLVDYPHDDDDDDECGFIEEEEEDDDTGNELAFVEEDNMDASDEYEFVDSTLSDHRPTQNYTVLKEEEIRQLEEDDIINLSAVLSIPKSSACFILPHFNWSVSRVNEEWFSDEDRVREKVGLLKTSLVQFNATDLITCGICFDEYPYESENIFSSLCGHPFCRDCWTSYIRTSVNDGPACLMLRCPEPSCTAAVGSDLISMLTTPQDHDRYKHFLLRSYVESHRKIKWCPAPGCQYAVKFISDGAETYDVSCLCSNDFCWNCTEEIHRPVDCETVSKWILKNKDDAQNAQWIFVNTKPCPKCRRAIEKNHGCNHMTCKAPCYFRFCWYCLVGLDLCRCNEYRAKAKKGDAKAERDKMNVKRYLVRYLHYYERWANNKSSKQKAIEDLHKVQNMHIKTLADIQSQSQNQLKFIIEAWKQIIECRQVLRWTYAYGYYMPHEKERLKVQLFEHLQGHALFSLERLHQCAESDMKEFLLAEAPLESFNNFRIKLTGLTKATSNYFEKLVTALENDLSEQNVHTKNGKALTL